MSEQDSDTMDEANPAPPLQTPFGGTLAAFELVGSILLALAT